MPSQTNVVPEPFGEYYRENVLYPKTTFVTPHLTRFLTKKRIQRLDDSEMGDSKFSDRFRSLQLDVVISSHCNNFFEASFSAGRTVLRKAGAVRSIGASLRPSFEFMDSTTSDRSRGATMIPASSLSSVGLTRLILRTSAIFCGVTELAEIHPC